jgi:hypothetical protein
VRLNVILWPSDDIREQYAGQRNHTADAEPFLQWDRTGRSERVSATEKESRAHFRQLTRILVRFKVIYETDTLEGKQKMKRERMLERPAATKKQAGREVCKVLR